MTREQILDSLRQLGEELDALGMFGEILLTGGAAMCLVHDARDMTKDIDALYEPKPIINKIVVKIAKKNDLPPDWLNDGVKVFLMPNVPREDFTSFKGLRIQTVSAEYLLAMKLMSSRYGEKDYDDIRFLFDKLGIKTYEQASDILTSFYDINTVPARTKYVIENIIDEQTPKNIITPLDVKPKNRTLKEKLADGQRKANEYNRKQGKSKQKNRDSTEH
jgi:hypothetical protein